MVRASALEERISCAVDERLFAATRGARLYAAECLVQRLLLRRQACHDEAYVLEEGELEEVLPKYIARRRVRTARSTKPRVFFTLDRRRLFCAHSWPCAASDTCKSASAAPTTRQQPLRLRAHASDALQLISFKSKITLRGARQQR